MIEELKEIREQLFDAPKDVKESFNNIVEYFGLKDKIKNKIQDIKDKFKDDFLLIAYAPWKGGHSSSPNFKVIRPEDKDKYDWHFSKYACVVLKKGKKKELEDLLKSNFTQVAEGLLTERKAKELENKIWSADRMEKQGLKHTKVVYNDKVEDLVTIKEQLFDAPKDVKESFNKVVQYFDSSNKQGYVCEVNERLSWLPEETVESKLTSPKYNDKFTYYGKEYRIIRKESYSRWKDYDNTADLR